MRLFKRRRKQLKAGRSPEELRDLVSRVMHGIAAAGMEGVDAADLADLRKLVKDGDVVMRQEGADKITFEIPMSEDESARLGWEEEEEEELIELKPGKGE